MVIPDTVGGDGRMVGDLLGDDVRRSCVIVVGTVFEFAKEEFA